MTTFADEAYYNKDEIMGIMELEEGFSKQRLYFWKVKNVETFIGLIKKLKAKKIDVDPCDGTEYSGSIEFKTRIDAERCFAVLNGQSIEGMTMFLSVDSSKVEVPIPNVKKLKITNVMEKDVYQSLLFEKFREFGLIYSIVAAEGMITEKNEEMYIKYFSKQSMNEASEKMNGYTYNGKTIKVSQEDHVQESKGQQKNVFSQKRGDENGTKNGVKAEEIKDSGNKETGVRDGVRLRVSNLEDTVSHSELFELFKAFGYIYKARVNIDKVTKKSQNEGEVIFSTRSQALNAQESLQGVEIKGKKIEISIQESGKSGSDFQGADKAKLDAEEKILEKLTQMARVEYLAQKVIREVNTNPLVTSKIDGTLAGVKNTPMVIYQVISSKPIRQVLEVLEDPLRLDSEIKEKATMISGNADCLGAKNHFSPQADGSERTWVDNDLHLQVVKDVYTRKLGEERLEQAEIMENSNPSNIQGLPHTQNTSRAPVAMSGTSVSLRKAGENAGMQGDSFLSANPSTSSTAKTVGSQHQSNANTTTTTTTSSSAGIKTNVYDTETENFIETLLTMDETERKAHLGKRLFVQLKMLQVPNATDVTLSLLDKYIQNSELRKLVYYMKDKTKLTHLINDL